MASNEDYLDSLLKAAMDSEQAQQDPTETLVEQQLNTEIDDSNRSLTPEEIAAMFAELSGLDETNETNESDVLDETNVSNVSDELNLSNEMDVTNESDAFEIPSEPEVFSEPEIPSEPEVINEDPFQTDEELEFDLDGIDDIDALLGLKEMPPNYKDELKQNKTSDASDSVDDANDENDGTELDLEDQDLSDILDLLGEDDSELAEINDILKKSDNNEIVDVDGINELETNMSKDIEDGQGELEAGDKTEKKKKRFGKKKTKENAGAESNESGEGDSSEKKEKKQNFFTKLMASLTEEIEDESDEENNQDLNSDAPAKKGKRKKGKKKDKQAESNEEILEEMDKEDAEASKKKKKEKKPKKKKEKKIKPVKVPEVEQSGKKLPQKMVIRIFVLCFSVLAVILIINSFIPGLLSLQKARKAFYNGKYTDAYTELIAQEKLNDSDTILLKKAEILTKLNNKMELYRTYTAAGMDLEGLHALLEGVSIYQHNQDIIQKYGISYEAEQINSQLTGELMKKYGLTPEQINEILQMDSVSYTYRLRELTTTDNTMPESSNPLLNEQDGTDENSAPVMPDVDTLEDPLLEELEELQ